MGVRGIKKSLRFALVCLLAPAMPVAADGIRPAPAFTPAELSTPSDNGWLTNGGTLSNQRYSPLTQVNRQNVKGLKAVWHVQLGSGKELRHNNQAQPLVHDGVVYIATGQNDVFAISVDTGKVLWEYRSGLKEGDAFVCCLWANRGVGLGDGRVYVGRVDAVLLALDQRTGKVLWQTKTGEPKLGYSLTAAPLYYKGMVIIGTAGGDLGIRGWVRAFDAKTGREIWRFDTVPGPGTAMPGNGAGRRCGARRPSIRNWGWSIFPPAIPGPVSGARCGLATISSRLPSSRWMSRPASIAGTSRRSTTTSGITMRRIP